MEGTIPRGYCQCGCGEKTKPAQKTATKHGHVKGQPQQYVSGHTSRSIWKPENEYVVEDRGYETPCWIWQKHISPQGYAVKAAGGERLLGHRYYYEQLKGPIGSGMGVDHLCRVKACVNPEHLEPVTQAINVQRGKSAKLTAEKVRRIKAMLASGMMQKEIAKITGVNRSTISGINRGAVWKNV